MSDDFAELFEADVDRELLRKLHARSSRLDELIQRFSFRNASLRERAQSQQSVQSLEVFEPEPVSPQLLSTFHQTCRDVKLMEQKLERLEAARGLLDQRIASASRVLSLKQAQYAYDAMSLLSSTAQASTQSPSRRTDSQSRDPLIELSMFERHLAAIDELRNGVKPKLYGDISVNIDEYLAKEEALMHEHSRSAERELLMHQLRESLQQLYQDGVSWQAEVDARNRVSDAFSRFVGAYQKEKYDISTFRLREVDRVLKEITKCGGDWNAAELLRNLEAEKQFLGEELAARGIGDAEMVELKEQMETQLLYLQHLTAVAGSALGRVGTGKVPVDVIEKMKVDIAEMEQRLSMKI